MSLWMQLAISGIIILLLFCGFYFLLQSASVLEAARKSVFKIMQDMQKKGGKKVVQAELEMRAIGMSQGASEKKGFVASLLMKLDDKLTYSLLSVKYTWLNSSVYFIGSIVLGAFGLLIGLLFGSWLLGFVIAFLLVFLPYAYVDHLTNANYKSTEAQIKFFINMVSSNAAASSDLKTVLEMSAPYVANPIRGAIDRALATAKLSQKPEDFVWTLVREIEHPLFVNFIRNLDMCAKYNADFRSVAKDFSDQADQSLHALERQRAIFADARNEILLMAGLGVVLMFVGASFNGTDLFTEVGKMTESVIGIACLCFECIAFGATLVYLLVGRRR